MSSSSIRNLKRGKISNLIFVVKSTNPIIPTSFGSKGAHKKQKPFPGVDKQISKDTSSLSKLESFEKPQSSSKKSSHISITSFNMVNMEKAQLWPNKYNKKDYELDLLAINGIEFAWKLFCGLKFDLKELDDSFCCGSWT